MPAPAAFRLDAMPDAAGMPPRLLRRRFRRCHAAIRRLRCYAACYAMPLRRRY